MVIIFISQQFTDSPLFFKTDANIPLCSHSTVTSHVPHTNMEAGTFFFWNQVDRRYFPKYFRIPATEISNTLRVFRLLNDSRLFQIINTGITNEGLRSGYSHCSYRSQMSTGGSSQKAKAFRVDIQLCSMFPYIFHSIPNILDRNFHGCIRLRSQCIRYTYTSDPLLFC